MGVKLTKVLVLGEGAESVRPIFERAKVLHAEAIVTAEEAARALQDATSRAHEIVQEAEEQAQGIRAAAYEEGKAEGLASLISELALVRAERRALHDAARRDLLDLAFGVARQVLGRELERDPTVVIAMVERALEHARGRRHIVIRLNPQDIGTVERVRAQLHAVVHGTQIHFEVDSKVAAGGCVIDTEGGQIQTDFGIQLDALQAAIRVERGEAQDA